MLHNTPPKSGKKTTGGGSGISKASKIPMAGEAGYSTVGNADTGGFAGKTSKSGPSGSGMGVPKGADFSMSGNGPIDMKVSKGHERTNRGKNSLKIGPSSMRG